MSSLSVWAVAALGLYLFVTLAAPRFMVRPEHLLRHPTLALITWTTALAVAAMSLVVGLSLLVVTAVSHVVSPPVPEEWFMAIVDSVAGWLALAVLGLIGLRAVVAAQDLKQDEVKIALLLATYPITERVTTVAGPTGVVDAEDLFALADASNRQVVVSRAVKTRLSPDELSAVVAHEFAHLRLHHRAVLRISRLAASVVPVFRATGTYSQVVRIATELAADDYAAKRCNPRVLARALVIAYPKTSGITERGLRLNTRSADRD
jgi:Zn-dependent protease with chaperone function